MSCPAVSCVTEITPASPNASATTVRASQVTLPHMALKDQGPALRAGSRRGPALRVLAPLRPCAHPAGISRTDALTNESR